MSVLYAYTSFKSISAMPKKKKKKKKKKQKKNKKQPTIFYFLYFWSLNEQCRFYKMVFKEIILYIQRRDKPLSTRPAFRSVYKGSTVKRCLRVLERFTERVDTLLNRTSNVKRGNSDFALGKTRSRLF